VRVELHALPAGQALVGGQTDRSVGRVAHGRSSDRDASAADKSSVPTTLVPICGRHSPLYPHCVEYIELFARELHELTSPAAGRSLADRRRTGGARPPALQSPRGVQREATYVSSGARTPLLSCDYSASARRQRDRNPLRNRRRARRGTVGLVYPRLSCALALAASRYQHR
jgi:hypothetical protein